MFTLVNSLRFELKLFSCHLSNNNLTHFETLANAKQSVILKEKNINIILSFDNEFGVTMNFSITITSKYIHSPRTALNDFFALFFSPFFIDIFQRLLSLSGIL